MEEGGMLEIGIESPKTVQDIEAIPESRNQIVTTRDQLEELIELPLLPACEVFYDNNIRTLSSTANRKNTEIEGFAENNANIILDYETLSDRNKQHVQQLCEVGNAVRIEDYDGRVAIELKFPVDSKTLVEELSKKAETAASQFHKQKMRWAPTYTQQQIADIFMSAEIANMSPKEITEQTGYYYGPDGLFYESEEHYIKSHEEVEE